MKLGKLVHLFQIFSANLKFQKEFVDEIIININNIKNSINIEKYIKQLILNFAGNEKPEEEIKFINFPSVIDFEKNESNETFRIYS